MRVHYIIVKKKNRICTLKIVEFKINEFHSIFHFNISLTFEVCQLIK